MKKSKSSVNHFWNYETIDTHLHGSVKYICIGPEEGEVVLFINGGGSSFFGVYAFEWLAGSGFRLISINRPGYCDMPLKKSEGFRDHARMYSEVLNALGIAEKVHVFGLSMGGLSALYFAKYYPAQSLVLWSAISGNYKVNSKSSNSVLGKIVLSNKGKSIISWILLKSVRYFPKLTIMEFLKAESDLTNTERKRIAKEVVNNQEGLEELNILIQSMIPMSKMYEGMMDEVEKATDLHGVDWSSIDCPTFLIHSKVDVDVPMEHAKRLERAIKKIETKYVRAGGHFVWWGEEGKEVKDDTKNFLIQHSKKEFEE